MIANNLSNLVLILFLFLKTYIYLVLAVLGLHCCKLAFSGLSLVLAVSFSLRVASLVCGALALELRGLSSCGTWADLSHSTWDIFLDQGLNPCPPAMAGGFLNTGPLGKSPCLEFIFSYSVSSWVKFLDSLPSMSIRLAHP